MHPILLNASDSGAWKTISNFFSDGGWFMFPILACSIVSVAVVAYKIMSLSRSLIIPEELVHEVEEIELHLANENIQKIHDDFSSDETTLARLCQVALHHAGRTQGEAQEAIQSAAREEIVKLNAGMPVLEVIITIAPLLGLLGTASGLVVVFANVGQNADQASVGQGIAMALNTTVAGLAVAVPTVIAHSHFSRKIELISARLEVLMSKVTSAFHQYVFFKN